MLHRTASAFGMPRAIATIDPRNVEHILKSKLIKYNKCHI